MTATPDFAHHPTDLASRIAAESATKHSTVLTFTES